MLLEDFRYALRTLRKAPLFTATAVATLTLGIGANTVMFTVLNAELLRPLPFAQPTRLLRVAEKNDKLNLPPWSTSILNYLSWKEQARSFESLGAIGYSTYALTGLGEPEQFAGNTITPSLLPLLALQPIVGRGFREDEDKPGSPLVAMISEGLWRKRFGASPALVGQSVALNGKVYTMVGVTPAVIAVLANGDIFTPLLIDPAHEQRLNHLITAVGRLKPGVSMQQAQSEMDAVAAHVGQEHPEVKDWGVLLMTFSDWFISPELRAALLVLMGAVAAVLLIACANIANLLLSRAASRRREVAIRTALGAGSRALLRQFLVESFLLGSLGGASGLLASFFALRLMNHLLPPDLLPLPAVAPGLTMDATVLWFTAAVTIFVSVLFGLAPAWYGARADIQMVLKQADRSSTSAGLHRWRHALVATELALATVLLTGAGLLLQTLERLQHVQLGFDSEKLLTFQLSPPPARYPNDVKARSLYTQMIEALEAQPGIRAVAISSGIPFGSGMYSRTPMTPVGPSALAAGQSLPIDWRTVSSDYFRTMNIHLLRGRTFSSQDGPDSPGVTVVSQETALRLWGSEDPIDRVLRVVANGKEVSVIGVVADVRNTALNQAPVPATYYSAAQRLWPIMDVAVRTAGDPEAAVPQVRRALHDLDPELAMAYVKTMDQWVSNSAAQPRLNAGLTGFFAGTALLIAVIGIYGVLSFSVSQRTRELGVRMAIGAQPSNIVRMIVGQGMITAVAGILIGLAAAAAFGKVLSSLLFEVPARNPPTFAAVALVLALAAALACYIPARRASRLDPVESLRED